MLVVMLVVLLLAGRFFAHVQASPHMHELAHATAQATQVTYHLLSPLLGITAMWKKHRALQRVQMILCTDASCESNSVDARNFACSFSRLGLLPMFAAN